MFLKFQLLSILFYIRHLKERKDRNKTFPAWTSRTGKFSTTELERIRKLLYVNISDTIESILNSDSVVALRVIAEIYLNEGIFSPRLMAIIDDERVNAHWASFIFDWGVDNSDLNYASDLLKIIWLTKSKPAFKSQHVLIGQNIQKLIESKKK